MPNSIKETIINDITIDGTLISAKDQVKFLSLFGNTNNKNINKAYKKLDKAPNSIKKVIKPEMNKKVINSITILLIIIYINELIISLY